MPSICVPGIAAACLLVHILLVVNVAVCLLGYSGLLVLLDVVPCKLFARVLACLRPLLASPAVPFIVFPCIHDVFV